MQRITYYLSSVLLGYLSNLRLLAGNVLLKESQLLLVGVSLLLQQVLQLQQRERGEEREDWVTWDFVQHRACPTEDRNREIENTFCAIEKTFREIENTFCAIEK